MNKELHLPYQNYKGEYSVRYVQPVSLSYKNSEWHGDCWHLEAYDIDKQAKREFDLEKIIRGTVQFTIKSLGESAHESKVQGIMNKIKGLEF